MKIVINTCHGGFGLSHGAMMRYAELSGFKLYPWIDDITKQVYGDRATLDRIDELSWCHYSKHPTLHGNEYYFSDGQLDRSDPILIEVVEEMGEDSYGNHAKLTIVDIPDDVEWEIEEYDGSEWVAEKHRTWG